VIEGDGLLRVTAISFSVSIDGGAVLASTGKLIIRAAKHNAFLKIEGQQLTLFINLCLFIFLPH
jgi:hypothetical protein